MNANRLAAGIAFLASLLLAVPVSAETTDPRVGKMTYEGSGLAEKAPEFGDVWFIFQVNCQTSADEVRKSIEAVSAKIWQTIATKVPASATNEKRQAYWGNIGNIIEAAGSYVQATPPNKYTGVLVPGSAQRINTCTGEKIALEAKVPTIYSGAQRIGVRSDDLDWLDSLAKTVKALPSSKAKDAVQLSVSAVNYQVTEGTKRTMLADTLDKARLEATGPNSKFASDANTLKFASAHYLGHHASQPPIYNPAVGAAVARGQAPKVTLEQPFVYTIYSEAKDVVDTGSSKTAGVRSEYEITGKASGNADYAQANTVISVRCQATKEAALAATEPYSGDLLKDLKDFQGTRAASETDRVENNEADPVQEYYPYQPVAWDTKKENFPPTKYLNTCTDALVDAPPSGQESDLPSYFSVVRTFSVKSKDFNGLLNLTEKLRSQYDASTLRSDETRVYIGDVLGQATEATKRQLAISARENATKYILDPNGPLAKDKEAHKFTSANLVEIREATINSPKSYAMAAAAPGGGRSRSATADEAPGSAPDLGVEVVHKPNEDRPQFRMRRNYAFDYEIVTKDYLPFLTPPKNAQPKPQPKPTGAVKHLL